MANPQIPVGSYVTFAVSGTDSNGNIAVTEPGDVNTAVSSSPSIVVAIDSVPAAGSLYSGTLTAIAPPTPSVSVAFTESHADNTSASITDIIDVVAVPSGEATTLGVTLGTPTPGPAPVSARKR